MNSEKKESFRCSTNINSIIAHDLRGYFSTILGYCDLLTQRLKREDPEKALQYCRIIHESAEQGMDFLTKLLEWGRKQTGEMIYSPEDFHIAEEMKDVLNYANLVAATKKITVHAAFNPELFLFADRNMIRTILMNLVSNAIKFCNTGGHINLSCRMVRGHVEFRVEDDGVGMEPDDLNRLFRGDTTFTTTGTGMEKGTGFGLPLCIKFVELHKGKIWAKSEPGKGSRFIFTVPDGHAGT